MGCPTRGDNVIYDVEIKASATGACPFARIRQSVMHIYHRLSRIMCECVLCQSRWTRRVFRAEQQIR